MILKSKIFVGGVAVFILIFVGVGYLYLTKNAATDISLGTPAVTVVRTNEGYVPKEVTIKKGEIVLFKNESEDFHWPASDLHPTHGVYPEFDPLKPITPGDTWQFKFDKVGVWKFHDHIRANKVGVVNVVE